MKRELGICIVEDQDDIREELKSVIQSAAGMLCLGAFSSGEEAVAKIPEIQPDLIVMDIHLPGMNGIEAVKQIKNTFPDALITMFTIFENSEMVFQAIEAGASGYLLKNTPHDRFIEALAELANGGSPMNAHIARKLVVKFRESAQKETAQENKHGLSEREYEVLLFLSKGLLYKEIALKMSFSAGTIKQHIHNIYKKLHVQNRTEAINRVFNS